jgi:hypothetical protein
MWGRLYCAIDCHSLWALVCKLYQKIREPQWKMYVPWLCILHYLISDAVLYPISFSTFSGPSQPNTTPPLILLLLRWMLASPLPPLIEIPVLLALLQEYIPQTLHLH